MILHIYILLYLRHDKTYTPLIIGSRLEHPKMADAFPGKQFWGRISPFISNRHSPYLDHMACIWVGMGSDNRIWQKRSILCKREGNKSPRDAGFSPSRFCHDAGNSIFGMPVSPWGCAHLFIGLNANGYTPDVFQIYYLYIHGLFSDWKPIWVVISHSIEI